MRAVLVPGGDGFVSQPMRYPRRGGPSNGLARCVGVFAGHRIHCRGARPPCRLGLAMSRRCGFMSQRLAAARTRASAAAGDQAPAHVRRRAHRGRAMCAGTNRRKSSRRHSRRRHPAAAEITYRVRVGRARQSAAGARIRATLPGRRSVTGDVAGSRWAARLLARSHQSDDESDALDASGAAIRRHTHARRRRHLRP